MEIESLEGMYSFKNQIVKIIWMSLPSQSEFIIAYKLTANEGTSGNQKINGTFSYIEGNETQKIALTPSNIFIEKDDQGVATIIIDDEGGVFEESDKPEEEVIAATEEVEKPEILDSPYTEELTIPQPEDDDKEPIAEVTSFESPESDVVYKVQIAAGHQSVPGNYFDKKYKLTEKISIENHEGWIKYTIGSFSVYKEGRDRRNSVWSANKINDAFVTAYNYGSRITVQEALMITNQKWYN